MHIQFNTCEKEKKLPCGMNFSWDLIFANFADFSTIPLKKKKRKKSQKCTPFFICINDCKHYWRSFLYSYNITNNPCGLCRVKTRRLPPAKNKTVSAVYLIAENLSPKTFRDYLEILRSPISLCLWTVGKRVTLTKNMCDLEIAITLPQQKNKLTRQMETAIIIGNCYSYRCVHTSAWGRSWNDRNWQKDIPNISNISDNTRILSTFPGPVGIQNHALA